jgi:RNA polymerase sigma-70 factor (ECF subfamily)
MVARQKDEVELAARARGGDSRAFAEIVRRYQGPIFRLCQRYLRGPEAEDAAQETFVRAFVHRQRFDPERPLMPWLCTIARRLCLDKLRKRHPDLDDTLEARTEDTAPTPERTAATREQLLRLQAALVDLPEGQREAILRYHIDGMSYQDIATSLEVPVGTVMTWLHRGRAKLRTLVEAGNGGGV